MQIPKPSWRQTMPFFLCMLFVFHNCFTSGMFWGLLKVWFQAVKKVKWEDYVQLAFPVILIEMVSRYPLTKLVDQKLKFKFYWSFQICIWCLWVFSSPFVSKARAMSQAAWWWPWRCLSQQVKAQYICQLIPCHFRLGVESVLSSSLKKWRILHRAEYL